MPTITVHHLEASRSFRILWMLEELGLDYDLRTYERDPKTMRAPPELARIHPLGRSPILEVDRRALVESGAILEYLADLTGQLRPTDPDALLEYRFFLHYAEGSAMPPLLVKLLTSRVRSAPLPFFVKPIARRIAQKLDDAYTDPEIARHFGFIEATLGERPFFAGEAFSAADVQMAYPIHAALVRGGGAFPNARAWLDRMEARPAWARAAERGGSALVPG